MRRKQSEEAKFPRVLPDKAAVTYKHAQSHTHLFPSPLLFSDIPNPCSPSEECWRGARGKDSLSTENLGCHLEEEKKACQLLGIKGGSWGTCSGAKPTNCWCHFLSQSRQQPQRLASPRTLNMRMAAFQLLDFLSNKAQTYTSVKAPSGPLCSILMTCLLHREEVQQTETGPRQRKRSEHQRS